MINKIKAFVKSVPAFFSRFKIKRGRERADKPKPRLRFLRNFWLVVILLPFALLFTQMLVSPVSAVIFVFLLLLPVVSFLYMLLGIVCIKMYLDSDTTEVEKYSEVSFSLAVSNESPLPFPFVEATLVLPGDNAIRCESRLTMLSLIPFGSYVVENKVAFRYRGAYDIGVSDIYICDFFHFFSYRMDVNLFRQIFVMPRRMMLPPHTGSDATIENTDSVTRRLGNDNTEMNDIRTYVEGDSLRTIHWKLSSKSQDLVVRQYSQNSELQTFVFVDTAERYNIESKHYDEDINEYAVDGVVEAAIAIVADNLRKANTSTTLVWFDSRGVNNVCCVKLTSTHDFNEIYRLFATAPVTKTGEGLPELTGRVLTGENDSVSLVYVTGCADKAFAASMSGIAALGAAGTEVFIYTPVEKVKPEFRQAFYDENELCISELGRAGASVYSAHFETTPPEAEAGKGENLQ